MRFKQKIYEKYQPQMDLSKEEIEELEYVDQKLRIEEKTKK
jgi:hypothetical protein